MPPLISALPYLVVAAFCAGAGVRCALDDEPHPRELLSRFDRAILLLVAVVAGFAWFPLMVVFVRGWLRDRLPKHIAAACVRARRLRIRSLSTSLARPAAAILPASPFQLSASSPECRPARVTAHSLWPAARSDAA
jgi:hypothetical protein